jgi:hypothetical protein
VVFEKFEIILLGHLCLQELKKKEIREEKILIITHTHAHEIMQGSHEITNPNTQAHI